MMMGIVMPSGRTFQGSAAKVCLKRSHQLLPKKKGFEVAAMLVARKVRTGLKLWP
jgi:hypothetical protein